MSSPNDKHLKLLHKYHFIETERNRLGIYYDSKQYEGSIVFAIYQNKFLPLNLEQHLRKTLLKELNDEITK